MRPADVGGRAMMNTRCSAGPCRRPLVRRSGRRRFAAARFLALTGWRSGEALGLTGIPSASTRASPWLPVAFPGLQATEPWPANRQEIHRFVSRRIGARTLERARYAGRAVGLRECQKPGSPTPVGDLPRGCDGERRRRSKHAKRCDNVGLGVGLK
jgi:hypothetical protein